MEGGKVESLSAPLLKCRGDECRHDDPVEQRVYEKLSIDNMLSKYVGDFGLAQLVHFVVVSLAWCLEGLHTLVMIFADREPEWQCRPSIEPYNIASNSTGALPKSPFLIRMLFETVLEKESNTLAVCNN